MLAGVAGGLAEYLGLDATVVRFGFVAASVLLLGGIGGPILYLAAWALIPEQGTEASIASGAMQSRPWEKWACGGATGGSSGATA
jgi:phage shock protein PspC (stress-responsive transcriptional regulator)